jgi:hypothetical protein
MFLPIILVCNLATMDLSVDPPIADCQNLYSRQLARTLLECQQDLVDNGIPHMRNEYGDYTLIVIDCLEVGIPAIMGVMTSD